MTDILERLRSVDISWSETGELCAEAADAIEHLRHMLQNGSPVVKGTIQHMAMEIAALKKERDELHDQFIFLTKEDIPRLEKSVEEWKHTASTYKRGDDAGLREIEYLQQRISELEACIKSHGIPVKSMTGGVAHYVSGIYDAKEQK